MFSRKQSLLVIHLLTENSRVDKARIVRKEEIERKKLNALLGS